LRDITPCCNAKRERRMSLEVLIGGKIFIFICLSCLISNLLIWQLFPSSDASDRYGNLKAS
jgi:hypothetical protein